MTTSGNPWTGGKPTPELEKELDEINACIDRVNEDAVKLWHDITDQMVGWNPFTCLTALSGAYNFAVKCVAMDLPEEHRGAFVEHLVDHMETLKVRALEIARGDDDD